MDERIGHEPFSDATLVWDGEPMRGGEPADPDLIPPEEVEPFDPGRITMRFRESNEALVGMPWEQPGQLKWVYAG